MEITFDTFSRLLYISYLSQLLRQEYLTKSSIRREGGLVCLAVPETQTIMAERHGGYRMASSQEYGAQLTFSFVLSVVILKPIKLTTEINLYDLTFPKE